VARGELRTVAEGLNPANVTRLRQAGLLEDKRYVA
jgi:hypothetical protein